MICEIAEITSKNPSEMTDENDEIREIMKVSPCELARTRYKERKAL